MAALNFPSNPVDGQLYPDPAIPGQQQYIYSSVKGTWQTVATGVTDVFGQAPIVVIGSTNSPTVTITEASITQDGYITAETFAKIANLPPIPGTVTEIKGGVGLAASDLNGDPLPGNTISTKGTLTLTPATRTKLGGVIPGAGLNITPEGRIDVASATKVYVVLSNLTPLFDGSRLSFPMVDMQTGQEVYPTSVYNLLVFVGGVLQLPTIAFTTNVGDSSLIFTEPPNPNATFYGVVFQ